MNGASGVVYSYKDRSDSPNRILSLSCANMELCLSCLLLLLATQTFGQNILSVLATHKELTTLNSHLNGSIGLSDLLSTANNFTFLAPSNIAFEAWLGQSPSLSDDEIESTLMYHFLQGGFPTLEFSPQPQFAITHLDNGTFANVTGGQVVEVVSDSLGTPQFLSGNRTVTTISQPVREAYCLMRNVLI